MTTYLFGQSGLAPTSNSTSTKICDQSVRQLAEESAVDIRDCLISEAEWFRLCHSSIALPNNRLLSDLTCLALRFGSRSDRVAELMQETYGVSRKETVFWFVSQITPDVSFIEATCGEVDRLLELIRTADRDLAEEAICWAEDFTMEEPDNTRIELTFGTPTV